MANEARMARQEPVVERIDAVKDAPVWDEILSKVSHSKGRLIVEEDGVAKAAVISYREYEFFLSMKAKRDEGFKILEEMSAPFKDVSPDEIEREVAKALAEVRAEMREERRLQAEQAARS
jgi:hypothetical protein